MIITRIATTINDNNNINNNNNININNNNINSILDPETF